MSSLKLKILILLATTTFFVSSTELSIADLSPERFVIVQRSNGIQEVIDTAAPLPLANVEQDDLNFYLYTIHNPKNPEILPLNVKDLESSKYFDKSKLIIISVHGWTNNYTSDSNSMVVDAYLNVTDVNILVFDWSFYCNRSYVEAYVGSTAVGTILGKFILTMQDYFHINKTSFHLVGHSMGAQVAGIAGKAAKRRVDLLFGLDPSGPLYFHLLAHNRIEKSSARHVQIIHTNAGQFGYLGYSGHSEFWVNGGTFQPGCAINLFDFCAHHRSYEFFAESLISGGFTSKFCCNHIDYSLNLCSSQEESYLGGLNADKKAIGNYFLKTAASAPFSLN